MARRMRGYTACRKSSTCIKRPIASFLGGRGYSVLQTPYVETFKVTCGSSGHVTLNIHHSPNRDLSRPLIIYINPFLSRKATSKPLHLIPPALLSNTVLEIQPRWSALYPFPTPLHDTLFAYDYIIKTFIPAIYPSSFNPSFAPSSGYASLNGSSSSPKLAVYGHGLGATIATSLALTECHPGQRPSLSALAARDGIYNWTHVATTPPPPRLSSQGSTQPFPQDADLLQMYAQRSTLFKSPANTFDAFASPILFFRTTGLAIPASFPCQPIVATAGKPASKNAPNEALTPTPYARRKSHLVFPSRDAGLRIPWARIAFTAIATGNGDVLDRDGKVKGKAGAKKSLAGVKKGRAKSGKGDGTIEGVRKEQATELVKLMRRSVTMHEAKARRKFEPDGEFDGDEEAMRRVGLLDLPLGQTDDDAEWAMEFFEEVL